MIKFISLKFCSFSKFSKKIFILFKNLCILFFPTLQGTYSKGTKAYCGFNINKYFIYSLRVILTLPVLELIK